MTPTEFPVLRIGVLGAASIARQFIAGTKPSALVKVVAVASRDPGKAALFARETGVERTHGSYDALLADDAVDAVYNPLPNGLHAEWSIRAAQAGKHVLCEKPLAPTAAEARAMFEAARAHGVRLVEAYPYMAQPQTVALRELVRAGAIGRIQLIQASFGFTLPDGPNIRLDPGLGAGALLDAGSYPVSLVRALVGERPARVHAAARWQDAAVDRTLAATLDFPGGALAQISCSFATGHHRHALIAGDGGVIETTFLNHPPIGGAPELKIKRGTASSASFETIELPGGNGFLMEAEAFARLVAGEAECWTGISPAESVDITATLEALRASALGGGWVDVADQGPAGSGV